MVLKKHFSFGLIFILFLNISCQESKKDSLGNNQRLTYKSKIDLSNKIWSSYASGIDDINNYSKNAYRIVTSGEVMKRGQIDKLYKKNKLTIDTVFTVFSTPANESKSIVYEIAGFTDVFGKNYRILNIWNENKDYLKEIEIVGKINPSKSRKDIKSLINRRNQWMGFCNQHLPDSLVSNLYAENAIYFNHKPLVVGKDSISKEYQYMKFENYNLKLSPLHVELVNENLVFEIGQCGGSYKGKYVLVWKKSSNGIWKILFDSNI